MGLSGGIDSALAAVIAVEAVGKENVPGVGMPGPYSSESSIADAREMAEKLNIRFEIISISGACERFEQELAPLFQGAPPGVTEENMQSRLRGVTLMALSNKTGSLLLTTGNKSELAVGYCTLYGDMCGGLAVISDVPKTLVYKFARVGNRATTERFRKTFSPSRLPPSCAPIKRTPIPAPLRHARSDPRSLRRAIPHAQRNRRQPETSAGAGARHRE